jgi:hypothetical protein
MISRNENFSMGLEYRVKNLRGLAGVHVPSLHLPLLIALAGVHVSTSTSKEY